MFKIDRTLAAQVVNTVKDVCGRDPWYTMES